MTFKVNIQYFAMLRDAAGKSAEQVTISAGETASSLYYRLAETYGFKLPKENIRVAINEEFSDFNAELKDQDRLVFIPPVAGG